MRREYRKNEGRNEYYGEAGKAASGRAKKRGEAAQAGEARPAVARGGRGGGKAPGMGKKQGADKDLRDGAPRAAAYAASRNGSTAGSPGAQEAAAERPAREEDVLPYLLMGRKAVKEALRAGRSIDRILVQKEADGSLRELMAMARERGVPLREVDRVKLDELCMPFGYGKRTGNHQGIAAQVPGAEYCTVEDILAEAERRGEAPFVLLLDGVEDPHNLGSIVRSAECAGAHGVIIPKRRAVGLTAAACKAAAGAAEYVKVAQVANLPNAMEKLKREGLWIAGADMAGQAMDEAPLGGPLALVVGGEGKGLSALVKKNCDFLVGIPMYGRIESLNASVAAALLLYAKRRADAAGGA